jgi:UDP-glucose 4-epimerase
MRRRVRRCVVLDSLVRGHRTSVTDVELIEGDIADSAHVQRIIRERNVAAVIQFDESAKSSGLDADVRQPRLDHRNRMEVARASVK